MKSYNELIRFPTFSERLEYLSLNDNDNTSPRHMSMDFYKSNAWLTLRKIVLDRDLGFDLGMFGLYIDGKVIVHHMNPITETDIIYQTKKLLSPDNLITTSLKTHNLIHYGREKDFKEWVERKPGDTKFW